MKQSPIPSKTLRNKIEKQKNFSHNTKSLLVYETRTRTTTQLLNSKVSALRFQDYSTKYAQFAFLRNRPFFYVRKLCNWWVEGNSIKVVLQGQNQWQERKLLKTNHPFVSMFTEAFQNYTGYKKNWNWTELLIAGLLTRAKTNQLPNFYRQERNFVLSLLIYVWTEKNDTH